MSWDRRYRRLLVGEIVCKGDEFQEDDGSWSPVVHSIGRPAPDPSYTSHMTYRRRKVLGLPWYKRLGIQVRIDWRVTPGHLSVRKWLFDAETHRQTAVPYNEFGTKRWWYALSIRVLGFDVGASIAYVTNPKEE